MMKFYIFFLLTFFSGHSYAQHIWESTNPGGGGAIATVGATKSGLIVAASDLSGVYVSSNNGVSWKVIGKTQGLTQTHISSLGFNPANASDTFIIGTGVGAFKTIDAGETVYPVNLEVSPNKGLGYVESIGMALSDATIGYMAHYEWWLEELSFLITTDAGENWSKVSTTGIPSNARIVKILVDVNTPSLVYALTGKARFSCSDPYLYRSDNSGQTWSRIATTNVGAIIDFDLHPSDPSIIYVSSFQMHPDACASEMWDYAEDVGSVYKSTNSGATFTKILDGMSGIISVGNNPLHISVTDIITDSGTWKTTDAGINWSNTGPRNQWFQGWLENIGNYTFDASPNGYNKSLTKDRFNPNNLYGSFGMWAWSSIDGGDHLNNISTTEITPDHYRSTGLENINGNGIEVSSINTNYVYLAGYDLGFWHSENHGESWKRSLPNLTNYPEYSWWAGGGSNCNFVLSDPENLGVVWAAFSADQPETKSAIFKSVDHGETWILSNTNLNPLGLSTHGLSIDVNSDSNNRTLYVTQEGSVWKSIDGGVSWSEIFTNNGDKGLKFTEVDKFNGQVVYAGGNAGFFRSTDAGVSWTETGLPEMGFTPSQGMVMRPDFIPETDDLETTPQIVHWQGVFDIKADPNHANRVYVVAHGDGKGLYRSDDAGITWNKIYNNNRMRGIAIAPDNSNIIYASSSTNYHSGSEDEDSIGMLVSYNAGQTWAFANDNLAWTNGGRLVIEPGANPHIWAWMPGIGIHHAPIPNFEMAVSSYKESNLPLVYPNPTDGLIKIRFNEAISDKDLKLQIFDNLGRLLLSNSKSKQIDISLLSKGHYILHSTLGQESWYQKVIRN